MLAALFVVSCDDTTDNIGSSLTDNVDKLNVMTDTFNVTTRSIVADSVLSRSITGYLGMVRDPETGAYTTSNFMTQFYTPENFEFPEKQNIISLDAEGNAVADSCDIRLYYTSYYGDSLATMKLSAYELSKPIEEGQKFYSNFNPEKDYITPGSTLKADKVYTLTDLNVDESTRKGSDYMPNIRISLNKNYGSKIIQEYYKNPGTFKNSYTFIHNLVPGFYFKTMGGIGSMAYISLSQLNVYFRHKTTYTKTDGTKSDTIITSMASFPGTQEVLQTTNISNDKAVIKKLVDDNTCTYIKSPAGIFTEMALPVDEIVEKTYIGADGKTYSHKNDTINTAKVVLKRINNTVSGKYAFGIPQTLLILPKADMYSFFENNRIADYKTSFLAAYNSSSNTYTFNNIGSLVKHLYQSGDRTKADWNKVVIIPVSVTYNTTNNVPELISVTHDMSMSSTRLVGGSNSKYGDIKISVIYSKFK